MAPLAYYNEIDPYAAAWLRNLIAAGHIAPGDVDERSIENVEPTELARYTQCHFFAGIGAWSYALRLAGWPDDRPVWTGSCPCQPFSTAGKGAGFADERHLWPAFHWLISQCRPPIVFGEQVASKDGLGWLDLVQADLEGSGYATGAADLCAAGVGAPHIRQRLYWVADAGCARSSKQLGRRIESPRSSASCSTDGLDNNNNNKGLEGHGWRHQAQIGHGPGAPGSVAEAGESGGVADADCERRVEQHALLRAEETGRVSSDLLEVAGGGADGGLADSALLGHGEHQRDTGAVAGPRGRDESQEPQLGWLAQTAGDRGEDGRSRPTHGHWRDADWLFCRDGKWRPVEPGAFPLAHGAPARVGRLRAYGNAIVPQVAQAFIQAYMTR